MIRTSHLFFLLLFAVVAEGKVYYCMDSQGQQIFSDQPCTETMMGDGIVTPYEQGTVSGQGTIQIKNTPVVLDDKVADRIRYHMSPTQVRDKYCAKYTQAERNRLVQTKQVVLGMYLADVIKVWGAPLSSDGNKVLFQDNVNEETVTVSLLEGCVINIKRGYMEDDEFYEQPIEDDINQ